MALPNLMKVPENLHLDNYDPIMKVEKEKNISFRIGLTNESLPIKSDFLSPCQVELIFEEITEGKEVSGFMNSMNKHQRFIQEIDQ
jgi:hypothetical protein